MTLLRKRHVWLMVLTACLGLAATADAATKTPEELTIALDTVWVMITACLVFFMNLGFALRRIGLLPGQEHRQHPVEELHRLRDLLSRLLGVRLGPDVRQRQRPRRHEGLFLLGGADNSPATGDAYKGAYSAIAWTGVPLWREVLLPARLRRHGRHDRVRVGGRAHQVPLVHRVLVPARRVHLSRSSATGSGAAAGWRRPASGTSPARPWCTASAAGRRSPGILVLGPRLGKYGPDGKVNADSGHSMTSRRDRLLRAVARLVRVQSRLDDGRRSPTPSPTSS